MEINKIKWIIFLDGSSYNDMFLQMFADFQSYDSVKNVVDIPKKKSLKCFLKSSFVRKICGSRFDFCTYEKNNLYDQIESINDGSPIIIIFTNSGLGYNPYFPYTLKKYKQIYPNLYFVALYLDIFFGDKKNITNLLFQENIFDLTYTIEKNDAEKLGMTMIRTPYSMQNKFIDAKIVNDIYWGGASKNRGKILSDIADASRENKIDCKMDIVCYENRDLLEKHTNMISIRNPGEYMEYSQLLKRSLAANCILDIVQPGQEALTLRPYEAVVYNRKLLTNNACIKDLSYYNSQYMKIFQSIEDIDWNWVKKREHIDYGYKGDFSPINFLEKIINDFKVKGLKIC